MFYLCVYLPAAGNSLPDYMREELVDKDTFRQHLKMFSFAAYRALDVIFVTIIPGAARVGPDAWPAAAIVNSPMRVLGCR